jgi:membrane protein YdbS with pleckstrin-like domain
MKHIPLLPTKHALYLFYSQATASKSRRIAFSILLAWAILNAVLTFHDWPKPWWLEVGGFVMSLLASLLFIGVLILVWDWVARRFHKTTHN